MRCRVLILVAAALGAVASAFVVPPAAAGSCRPPGAPRPLPRREVPPDLEVDPPIDTPAACPTWRWVAVQRDAGTPCPDPGPAEGAAWSVGPLFSAGSFAELPPALRPFCLYQVRSGDAATRAALQRNLERLVRRGALREVESGCAAVGPMAMATPDDATWPLLRDHFLEQAAGLSRIGGPLVEGPPRVRLALLDTQPVAMQDRPGNSHHGFTLGRMARALVCEGAPGAACAARVVQRLALPIAGFDGDDPARTDLDFENGGHFGTIDQLAQAVWEELEAWRASGEDRLVLQLSVAWVGERFGGLERRVREMPVPVRALYRALELASCRGALVVAAAGNRVGGPELESGPLLPGGWERRPAPTPRRCAALFGETAARRSAGDEPLVYAAAGVRTDGAPLVNARPASQPPRVAYADHAVVERAESGLRTAILTGSSVATGVVASAAAVVWHHRPELVRSQVMEVLESSGEPMGRSADVFLGRSAPDVRRIAVCPALAIACREGGGRCPAAGSLSCPEPSRKAPELSRLRLACTAMDFEEAERVDAGTFTEAVAGSGFCEARELRFEGDPPADPCPSRQFFVLQARPWTGPQPQSDPCVGCEIRPPPDTPSGLVAGTRGEAGGAAAEKGFVLRIDVDPEWSGGPLEAAILDLGDVSFALGLEPLEAGDCAVVENLDPALLASDADGFLPSAALSFRTAHGAIESPLFISR